MVAINQGFWPLPNCSWNPVDSHSFMSRKLHHFRPQCHLYIIYILLQMFNTLVRTNALNWWWKKWWYGGLKSFFGPQVMLVNHFIFKSILKMLHLSAMMRNFQNLLHLYITSDACPIITITNLANNFEKL